MEQIARTAAIGAATIVGAKYLDANLDLHHDLKLIVNGIKNQILFRSTVLITDVQGKENSG